MTAEGIAQSLDDLAHLPRWLGWRNEVRGDPPVATKVPYCARSGFLGKATDPFSWSPRDACEQWAARNVNGQGGGVGIALGEMTDDLWLCGIDLDTCRTVEDGTRAAWANAVIDRFASYAEISPSQTGVKMFFLVMGGDVQSAQSRIDGKLGREWKQRTDGRHPPAIALYLGARYFTVTGDRIADHPLRCVPLDDLVWLIDEHAPATFPPSPRAATGERTSGRDNTRSGRAFHLALRLRRENGTKQQFIEVLQADPELAEWARDARQVQRAWEAACRTIEGQTDPDAEQAIKRLAALDRVAYDREREDAAERLHIRVSTLDALVRQVRSKGDRPGRGKTLELPSPEPWPDEVKGHELLDGLAAYFKRHAVLPDHAADAVALWVVHAHGFTAFRMTPRLQFTAATRGSGKSTMIELVGLVVPRPIETETVTPAFLFRAIEMVKPVLLIDEVDTVLHADNHELRGLINAGHKQGAQAGRVVGDDLEPRLFDCFCPVVLAGIGRLPGTIEDRSITIQMKRRRRDEPLAPIDDTAREMADQLCRKAAAWVARNAETLARHRPDMCGLFNRTADRWAPLFAVADLSFSDWPSRAREAQTALDGQAREDDSTVSLGERLLADLRDAFGQWVAENPGMTDHEMESAEVVRRLTAMEERGWTEMPGRRGGPLTQHRLARLLAPFGVRPEMIGPEDRRRKGYRLLAFSDAFERHLSSPKGG